MFLHYLGSVFLWQFLSPFGIWQSIVQNAGQVVGVIRSRLARSGAPEEKMSLPFEGVWHVANGGADRSASHSWNVINQRYAYDFVCMGGDGKSHRGDGRKLEDYYAFDRNVLAPCDGTVVWAKDGARDCTRPGTGRIDLLARDMRGNCVMIRHGRKLYSFIGHLRKGSCAVRPGDIVKRGQVIGKCGNSGHSTEPHIHFHLQDHPNFYMGMGLPIPFWNVEIVRDSGGPLRTAERAYIARGSSVRNLAPADAGQTKQEGPEPLRVAERGGAVPLLTGLFNALGLVVWVLLIYLWALRPLGRAVLTAL